jgi:uncharacterized membrane protein
MRWLMIGLLVSLAALLIAAAGMVRHVWLQRKLLRHETPAEPETSPQANPEAKP